MPMTDTYVAQKGERLGIINKPITSDWQDKPSDLLSFTVDPNISSNVVSQQLDPAIVTTAVVIISLLLLGQSVPLSRGYIDIICSFSTLFVLLFRTK